MLLLPLSSITGTMSFAFVCQHNSFLVFRTLRIRTSAQWVIVVDRSLSFALTISLLFGLVGFFTFYPSVDGDLLNNFPVSYRSIAGARLLLATTMVFTFPMECYVTRHCLIAIVRKWNDGHSSDGRDGFHQTCLSTILHMSDDGNGSGIQRIPSNDTHSDITATISHSVSSINNSSSVDTQPLSSSSSSSSNRSLFIFDSFKVSGLSDKVSRWRKYVFSHQQHHRGTRLSTDDDDTTTSASLDQQGRWRLGATKGPTQNTDGSNDDGDDDLTTILFHENKVLILYDVTIDDHGNNDNGIPDGDSSDRKKKKPPINSSKHLSYNSTVNNHSIGRTSQGTKNIDQLHMTTVSACTTTAPMSNSINSHGHITAGSNNIIYSSRRSISQPPTITQPPIDTSTPAITHQKDRSCDLSPTDEVSISGGANMDTDDRFITEHVPLVTHVALTMLLWGTPLSIAMATDNLGVVSAITGVVFYNNLIHGI